MTIIIDGRKIKENILENIKEEVSVLPFTPVFYDVVVGDDKTSALYVRIKSKNAISVGIKFRTIEFPNSITTEELIEKIDTFNKVPHLCGLIVQLPLPNHIDRKIILDAINPSIDVDCLGKEASEKFYNDIGEIKYPTAIACLNILDSLNLDLTNKKIVVLGQGVLVGRPVAHLLRSEGLQIETINSKTDNTLDLIKNADVIISGIGQGKFITGEMIKKGVVIIDAGTSEENGAIIGDVDVDSVMNIASYITPSPGGVGPVTVAMLLKNVLKTAKNKK